MIKGGTRLGSQVCQTEVIVIKSSDGFDDLRCGGTAMVPVGQPKDADAVIDPAFADGTALGKRYTDAGGNEVLVTKPGAGSLSLGDVQLTLKDAKPLPASD